jgi:hypothetical protein
MLRPQRLLRLLAAATLLTLPSELVGSAQGVSPGAAVTRIEGKDPATSISYVRLFLEGRLLPVGPSPLPPLLTAECMQRPDAKLSFEIFANFGGVEDRTFHPPWQSTADNRSPRHLPQSSVTMEFLGYTHVKPVKRMWEQLPAPVGEFRYHQPGLHSHNLEDFAFYIQYLKALPTLRLTLESKTAEFLTAPLLDQLRKEPICLAAHA